MTRRDAVRRRFALCVEMRNNKSARLPVDGPVDDGDVDIPPPDRLESGAERHRCGNSLYHRRYNTRELSGEHPPYGENDIKRTLRFEFRTAVLRA